MSKYSVPVRKIRKQEKGKRVPTLGHTGLGCRGQGRQHFWLGEDLPPVPKEKSLEGSNF